MCKVLNSSVQVPHPTELTQPNHSMGLVPAFFARCSTVYNLSGFNRRRIPRESGMTLEQNHENGDPRPSQIVEALRLILRSARFSGSKQCQTLLQYLVEHSLRGQDDELKERIIGIEVFGRKSDYDTSEDAVVRARVGEVRKRLAQYYTSEEGQDSPVRVVIAPGSYRPTFVLRPAVNNGSRSKDSAVTGQLGMAGSHVAEDHPPPETAPSIPSLPRKARWHVWGLAAAAACVVLLVAWIGIPKWTKSELDIFWGPILDSKKPAVIYAGTAPVYIRSMESVYREQTPLNPNEEMQPATRWTLPPVAERKVLTAKDLLVDPSGYVEVGDVKAAMTVTGLLGGRRRSFDLRIGPDLAFEDLHGAPTVLVGGYANFWTMFMNRDLRFYFDRNLNIRERGGQGRVWSISHEASRAASSTITEDYAIVCRLFDSKTGAPVIALAGTTTCGTRAASEFLADPVSMRKLGSIPRDVWERKNLELVLHAPLINCNPTSVEIVAEHTW